MNFLKSIIQILFFIFISINILQANNDNSEINSLSADSINSQSNTNSQKFTLKNSKELKKWSEDSIVKPKFKPDPIKVVWMGAIIPGYGQIMNRSYWKVPIVYGGFLGFAYAINTSAKSYDTYKQAYKDIIDLNENTNSFLDVLPNETTLQDYPGGKSGLQKNLAEYFDKSRRNRDLTIILAIAYYGITLIEAYVDAQLFDFDISTDLSMHIRPNLINYNTGYKKTLGLQLSFNLK